MLYSVPYESKRNSLQRLILMEYAQQLNAKYWIHVFPHAPDAEIVGCMPQITQIQTQLSKITLFTFKDEYEQIYRNNLCKTDIEMASKSAFQSC